MKLPSLFRAYNHKRFSYRPWFYDERKEDLENRIRLAESDGKEIADEEYHSNLFRGSFRHASAYRSKANRASSLRVLMIIAILALFIFFLITL